MDVIGLENSELWTGTGELAGTLRRVDVRLLRHLGEIERRELHLQRGYSSLFRLCVDALKLSEASAYRRVIGARAVRDYPVVGEMLERGEINMCTLSLVAKSLKAENHVEILAMIKGQSKRDVEIMAAGLGDAKTRRPVDKVRVVKGTRLRPRAPAAALAQGAAGEGGDSATFTRAAGGIAAMVTSVADGSPATFTRAAGGIAAMVTSVADGSPGTFTSVVGGSPATVTSHCGEALVLGADAAATQAAADEEAVIYQLTFTAGEAFMAKVKRAREVMSHSLPQGTLEQIFMAGLDALLVKKDRAARGVAKDRAARGVAKDRAAGASKSDEKTVQSEPRKRSRYVPKAVKTEVWKRDESQCSFTDPLTGRRCGERRYLEIDHIQPFALGGRSDEVDQLRLYCDPHNRWRGRQTFGGGSRAAAETP